ncbi:helix-turn-helix transcriptional regulator [Xenorhabdus sp. XENO-10]|uniref:Helix-turn-helix transcriptional regulator n=1 Tax=Xenorhabdus yunnanensis TaxID=3025878 RepID=A0ABT5LBW0_9GAMM|nr:helix-turn-helix transcriptional regulator [Xenorhabdus yunnanensis]MDC9588576.1 helix-turn-helix transcriptional regulator [Xenorhabdus yunnanensis]
MEISEKIKAIRSAENLTQIQLCEVMCISISTLKKIEAGYREPSWETITKITMHPKFEKYALWLMTDKTAPESGQISPL